MNKLFIIMLLFTASVSFGQATGSQDAIRYSHAVVYADSAPFAVWGALSDDLLEDLADGRAIYCTDGKLHDLKYFEGIEGCPYPEWVWKWSFEKSFSDPRHSERSILDLPVKHPCR